MDSSDGLRTEVAAIRFGVNLVVFPSLVRLEYKIRHKYLFNRCFYHF